ncbi:hypothetical protein ABPG74_000469 [Tetrahymena malaccensis]
MELLEIKQQLDNQNINYTQMQGTFQIIGQQQNLAMYLNIEEIDVDQTQFKMIFSNFTILEFSSLQIINNKYEGKGLLLSQDEQNISSNDSMVMITNCANLIIANITIIQQEKMFAMDFFNFQSQRFTLKQGKIIYSMQFKKELNELNMFLSNQNDDYNEIFVENMQIKLSLFQNQTNQLVLFNINRGKTALFRNLEIQLNISEVQNIGEFKYQVIKLSQYSNSVQINNIRMSSHYALPLAPSSDYLAVIQIDSPFVQVDLLQITCENVFLYALFIQNSFVTSLKNVYIANTNINNPDVELIARIINYQNIQQLLIDTLYIQDTIIINVSFIYFTDVLNTAIQNVFFTRNKSLIWDNDQKSCFLQENFSNVTWYDAIFTVQRVYNLTANQFKICALSSLRNVRGLFILRTLEDPYKMDFTVQNINQYIDKSNGYDARIIYTTATQNLNLLIKNYSLFIDQQSYINLDYASFFYIYIQGDGALNLQVDSFYLEGTNINQDSSFITRKGTLFRIISKLQGNYYTTFNNFTAINIKCTGFGGIIYITSANLIILNSQFRNIYSGKSGGVLYTETPNIRIKNTIFDQNQAKYFGGAIYFKNNYQFKLNIDFQETSFLNGQASIGGAIVGPKIIKNIPNINYSNNFASLYGNDYSEDIQSIKVKQINWINSQFKDTVYENITIQNDPIQYNIQDLESQKQLVYIEQAYANYLYQVSFNFVINNKEIELPADQDTSILNFSSYIQQFSLDNKNIDLTSQFKSTSYYFLINFPLLAQYPGQVYQSLTFNNLYLEFIIQQNKTCSSYQGLILNNNKCQFCTDFSVTNKTNAEQQLSCLSCNSRQHKSCFCSQSILNEGFIRYGDYTVQENQTIYCNFKPQNCIGGEGFGNQNCKPSQIGPQCLSCDTYNNTGYGNFLSNNNYSCVKCYSESFNEIFFILQFFFAFMIAAIFFFSINTIMEQQTQVQLQSQQNLSQQQLDTGKHFLSIAYLKILIFYLNIIYIGSFYESYQIIDEVNNYLRFNEIFTFQINIYNPLQSSYFSYLQCYLIQMYPETFKKLAKAKPKENSQEQQQEIKYLIEEQIEEDAQNQNYLNQQQQQQQYFTNRPNFIVWLI